MSSRGKFGLLEDGAQRSDELPDAERLPAPGMGKEKSSDADRITKIISAVGSKVNPELAGCLTKARPAITAVIRVIMMAWPLYRKAYSFLYFQVYKRIPANVLPMVFGVCLCFFGGTYVASIAAIEAFRQLGWQKVHADLVIIADQAKLVNEASKEDDLVDDDNDGVADVDQMAAAELAQHKLEVAMKTVSEPERLQNAFGNLFVAYLAVLATLRLEFARTTAFALGIVEMVRVTAIRALLPMVTAALGEDLAHWSKTLIESSLTFFSVIIAWWIQTIISAFYSGLRGGKMFADGLVAILNDKNLIQHVPLIAQPFDPDESYLDEVVGYTVAALGFAFQLFNGFALPFPLNIVFLPLTIVEFFLKLQISASSTPLPASG